jgi:succinate dehydrogenase cytochrome b subunit
MYRGREGMWSYFFHRVSGVAILIFLLAHIVDTMLLGWGPGVYDKVVKLYAHPGFMVGEIALLAGVLYHALNGIRIFIIDFTSLASRIQQRLFWIEIMVFLILFVPAAYIMIRSVL